MKRKFVQSLLILISLFAVVAANAADKPPVYVTFWFDTEDFILPQADDAALRLANMFNERNVQATFKIVGEKARVLERRGRDDVIDALSQNDVAYHSTDHSVHPTPSEYSRDLSWDEGVSEFIRREGVGLDILQRVFGVNSSCYGQPGGSWTPQSYAALRAFQIPVYLDATPHVNLNDRPFWYGGALNVLEMGDCVLRTGFSDEAVKEACAKFDSVCKKLEGEGGGLVSIYYHPCEFVHEEFWDGVNFSEGKNPPRHQWKRPPMKSPEESEQAYKAFEDFLDYIIDVSNVRVVTARELASLYVDRAYNKPITRKDIDAIVQAFRTKLSFVDLGDRILSAGEGLTALSAFAVGIWDTGLPQRPVMPAEVDAQFAFGPASAPERFLTQGEFYWNAIQNAAEDLNDFVKQNEQLPSVVWIDGQPLRLEDFAVTLAKAMENKRFSGELKYPQKLCRAELEAKKYVANDDDPGMWGWIIFPKDFHAPRLMELAKLQAWTIKPAVLRKVY